MLTAVKSKSKSPAVKPSAFKAICDLAPDELLGLVADALDRLARQAKGLAVDWLGRDDTARHAAALIVLVHGHPLAQAIANSVTPPTLTGERKAVTNA